MLVEKLNIKSGQKIMEAIELFCTNFSRSSKALTMYAQPLNHAEKIFTLTDKNKVISALKMDYNSERDIICVDFLATSYLQRGKGFGGILLSEFERRMKESGNNKIGLLSRSSPEVVNFYLKRGYALVPEYRSCWMEKNI